MSDQFNSEEHGPIGNAAWRLMSLPFSQLIRDAVVFGALLGAQLFMDDADGWQWLFVAVATVMAFFNLYWTWTTVGGKYPDAEIREDDRG